MTLNSAFGRIRQQKCSSSLFTYDVRSF